MTNTSARKTRAEEETVHTRSPLLGEGLEPAGDVRRCGQYKEQSLRTQVVRRETYHVSKLNRNVDTGRGLGDDSV